MSQKALKKTLFRLICRCTEPFHAWVSDYADYVQISVADLICQALLRHADNTGYSGIAPPPQRVIRQRPSTYRPPGPWPERTDP